MELYKQNFIAMIRKLIKIFVCLPNIMNEVNVYFHVDN